MNIIIADAFTHYDLGESFEVCVLTEGKGLHTVDAGRDDIRQAVVNAGFQMNPRGWKAERRGATTVSKKQFDDLQERLSRGIINYSHLFLEGKINKTRWLTWVRHLLRDSYQEAFKLGMKSSGASSVQAGVATFDKEWVAGAARHELQFFNRLLQQIQEGTYKGELTKRLKAYSEALQHVYYSGRVMGTPEGHIIDWVGPNDRATCNGCRFLAENSPYTKLTLPTTPRAGDTRCLHNCRDRLVIRHVGLRKFESVQKGQRSKRWYQEKLRRLKDGLAL